MFVLSKLYLKVFCFDNNQYYSFQIYTYTGETIFFLWRNHKITKQTLKSIRFIFGRPTLWLGGRFPSNPPRSRHWRTLYTSDVFFRPHRITRGRGDLLKTERETCRPKSVEGRKTSRGARIREDIPVFFVGSINHVYARTSNVTSASVAARGCRSRRAETATASAAAKEPRGPGDGG